MLKHLLRVGLCLCLGIAAPAVATAGPYFTPGLNRVNPGIFQGLGQDRTDRGFVVPIIVHDKTHGYWLIPGITWDLLDLGYSEGAGHHRSFRIGPSVNLDEPVKAALRFACRAIPGWSADERYGLLKTALAPTGTSAGATIALGPSFRVDVPSLRTREWTGGWDFAFTLAIPVGGGDKK